jgi:hypothetical protein
MPDLAEAIRVHMRDGGQPITFDEIAGRAATARPALRTRGRFTHFRPLERNGHGPRSLRVPAIAWAGLLAIVLVAVIVGVSVSGNRSPSPVSPANHGSGPRTSAPPVTRTSTPSAKSANPVVAPNVVGTPVSQALAVLHAVGLEADQQLVSSPAVPAGEVETQSPSAGVSIAAGSVIVLQISTGPEGSQPASTPLGIFTDGSEGRPYYFISLFGSGDSVGGSTPRPVEGSLDFLYQDGQSSVVFTFDGTWSGTNLTMHPTSFPKAGSAVIRTGSVPQTIQATTISDLLGVIRLPNCSSYLRLATTTQQCEFVTGQTTIGDSGPGASLGTYSDGAIGSPHYVVTITTSTGDEIDGSIDYLDQDGRTATAISFYGFFQGSVAVITERRFSLSAPSISVLVADRELLLGECFDYLTSIQTDAQCTFDQMG